MTYNLGWREYHTTKAMLGIETVYPRTHVSSEDTTYLFIVRNFRNSMTTNVGRKRINITSSRLV